MICDMCQNYCYDEEYDEYYCDINLDEDEYLRFLSTVTETKCPYFKNGDEYTIVRKQNQSGSVSRIITIKKSYHFLVLKPPKNDRITFCLQYQYTIHTDKRATEGLPLLTTAY